MGGSERYSAVSIALHWLIALGILALIGIGLAMTHLALAPMLKFQLYQLHKSIGITVLLAVLLRILWRFFHRPPALPDLPRLEKAAAEGMHTLLYLLMVMLPLTGWALVSVSPFNLPTVLYGLVPWPHLPRPVSAQGQAAGRSGGEIHPRQARLAAGLRPAACRGSAAPSLRPARRRPAPNAAAAARPQGNAFMKYALFALTLAAAAPAHAAEWTVDQAKSRLGFSGVQTGTPFQGSFGKWQAEISFDPAHPEAGHAR